MANESEFETVISEADVEVGVIQNQNEGNNQNSAPSQVQSAPVGRFGIFSMSFLQQYFDVNTEEIKNRLLATFVPFKGKTLFEYTTEKADLYVAFCVACMYPIFMLSRRIKANTLDDYLSACASSVVLYGLLLCCCAVYFWFASPVMGIPIGIVNSISFSAYYILVSELVSMTPLRYLGLGIIYLCVISYFNFNKAFPEGKKMIGLAIMFVFSLLIGLVGPYML